jgi:hypothetical protein
MLNDRVGQRLDGFPKLTQPDLLQTNAEIIMAD